MKLRLKMLSTKIAEIASKKSAKRASQISEYESLGSQDSHFDNYGESEEPNESDIAFIVNDSSAWMQEAHDPDYVYEDDPHEMSDADDISTGAEKDEKCDQQNERASEERKEAEEE